MWDVACRCPGAQLRAAVVVELGGTRMCSRLWWRGTRAPFSQVARRARRGDSLCGMEIGETRQRDMRCERVLVGTWRLDGTAVAVRGSRCRARRWQSLSAFGRRGSPQWRAAVFEVVCDVCDVVKARRQLNQVAGMINPHQVA